MAENRTKSDQYLLRMPPGLRDELKEAADRHSRSLNAEIVARLEAHPRLVQMPMHVSYLETERVRLSEELAATITALAEQKVISSQLQQIINESSDEAERDQETENVIETKFNCLKAQSDYLEALKAEILELAKERDKIKSESKALVEHPDDPIFNIVLDAKGHPISWPEIAAHIHRTAKAAGLQTVSFRAAVVNADSASSSDRDLEYGRLVRWYQEQTRKHKDQIREVE